MAKLEIGKSAAILLTINRGLFEFEALSEEEFNLLDARYRRPLKEIIEANKQKREPSHTPVLELAKKQKEIFNKHGLTTKEFNSMCHRCKCCDIVPQQDV